MTLEQGGQLGAQAGTVSRAHHDAGARGVVTHREAAARGVEHGDHPGPATPDPGLVADRDPEGGDPLGRRGPDRAQSLDVVRRDAGAAQAACALVEGGAVAEKGVGGQGHRDAVGGRPVGEAGEQCAGGILRVGGIEAQTAGDQPRHDTDRPSRRGDDVERRCALDQDPDVDLAGGGGEHGEHVGEGRILEQTLGREPVAGRGVEGVALGVGAAVVEDGEQERVLAEAELAPQREVLAGVEVHAGAGPGRHSPSTGGVVAGRAPAIASGSSS